MATETTVTSAKAWAPDVSTYAAADVIPDALIMQTSTVAGSVEGDAPTVRVAYVDDADATFTAEGVDIDEADPNLSETLIHTAKITQLLRLSREQYEQEGTSAQLAASVQRAVTKKANEAYLAQIAPTPPAMAPPAGLLNIAGIQAGGEVGDDLDQLVDLVAELEGDGATPSHLVLDPRGWAALRKLKVSNTSNQSLLGTGSGDAERRLIDLPVLVSPAMTPGAGLVIDRGAVVSAVGAIQVASNDSVYFNSDSIALRCTWRLGWNVVRPNRIGRFTVAGVSAGSGEGSGEGEGESE